MLPIYLLVSFILNLDNLDDAFWEEIRCNPLECLLWYQNINTNVDFDESEAINMYKIESIVAFLCKKGFLKKRLAI